MSMYVSLHSKGADTFKVESHIVNNSLVGAYPVVQMTTQSGTNLQEITLYSTPDQLQDLVDHIRHVLDELELLKSLDAVNK